MMIINKVRLIALLLSIIPFYPEIALAKDEGQITLEAANLKKAVYCTEVLEVHLDIETAERE